MTTTSTTNDHDPTDELAMPHFEEQLWAEIRAHHEDGTWTRPAAERDHAPVTLSGRPAIHRRAARRSLAAAAVLAVIAAAGALSSSGGGDGRDRAPRPDQSEAPAAGEIEAKTIAAIDAALADSVIHAVYDGSWHEVWYDAASHTSRTVHRDPAGVPLWEVGPAVAPALDGPPGADVASRQINYCSSEYAEVTTPRYTEMAVTQPEIIRDQLAEGYLVADGTEVVDGRELIRLVETGPEASSAGVVYYVDPETYRPLLVRTSAIEAEPEPTLQPMTITVEYLPRTAENLSQLVPSIPDGFTRVTEVSARFIMFPACD